MESNNPTTTLKTLKTIHWALIAGLSLFAGVVAFQLGTNSKTQFFNPEDSIIFIPSMMGIFLIPTSMVLFKKQLIQIKDKTDLSAKMMGFQSAHIVKMAMLEGVGLFSIVACFVSYTTVNFFLFGLVIILMAGSAPTVFKLTEQLDLTQNEAQSLESNK